MTLAALVVGPAQALAITETSSQNVQTSMTFVANGGSVPVVNAKWEMYKVGYMGHGLGEDADGLAGAQFEAPGIWGKAMEYTVCAVVTDPYSVDDNIAEVNARIYYPENRPMHTYNYNLGTGAYQQTEDPDYPSIGCGSFIEKNTLIKQGRDADSYLTARAMLCDSIKGNNFDLPTPGDMYTGSTLNERLTAMYNDLCGTPSDDGKLFKNKARIYCDNKYLIWEDTAGDYKVEVEAVNDAGAASAKLNNWFTYKPNYGFETDFLGVNYDNVMYNSRQVVPGDKFFCSAITDSTTCSNNVANECYWDSAVGTNGKCLSTKPTVRNTGNTNLIMKIAQDDMGLATNGQLSHVQFDARVGQGTDKVFNPFRFKADTTTAPVYTALTEILDLSEVEEMDFSIKLLNPPYEGADDYDGSMWLKGVQDGWRDCRAG